MRTQKYEMQNWRAILSALEGCTSPSDLLFVVHSSISRLRPPSSAGKWTFLRALRALLDQGRTLALPTFTFGFCQVEPFRFRDSPSETGVLGEWLLALDGARRTRHPIYSFAVAGPAAGEIEGCVGNCDGANRFRIDREELADAIAAATRQAVDPTPFWRLHMGDHAAV